MKTILVTGGTGFIGSNLCHRLIADGERVICLDNNYTGSLENVQELLNHPRFTFVEHDVIEPWDCLGEHREYARFSDRLRHGYFQPDSD